MLPDNHIDYRETWSFYGQIEYVSLNILEMWIACHIDYKDTWLSHVQTEYVSSDVFL